MDNETDSVTTNATENVGIGIEPTEVCAGPWLIAGVASFLARYRNLTLRVYRQDILAFLRWCAERQLAPLTAERPHLEPYLRWMESRGLVPAMIGRRFGRVAGCYKYAVLDGNAAVTRR